MSLLKIEHLRKTFGDVTPIEDLSLDVEDGEVISIIGPSGTGKSTLLRCINQLEEPTSGTVIFDGETITDPDCDIARVRRKMGMVFQQFNLFANCNIIENVISAPIKLLKIPRAEALVSGMELLTRFGLADKANHYPDELSGGQQQRAAIARAVAMNPRILLFDEPTSALDPTMIAEVLAMIRMLAKTGMTMLIVTHEMQFARDVSTRILYIDEGGIYEDGTPDQIFDHPVREKTRRFVRRLKTLSFTIPSSGMFDFLGSLSEIDRFGQDNLLPPVTIRNLQLFFEEMIMQNIVPHLDSLGEGWPIRSVFEYSKAEGKIVLSIYYGGGCFNPLRDGDALSARLVRGIASLEKHSYDENSCDEKNCDEKNCLELTLLTGSAN